MIAERKSRKASSKIGGSEVTFVHNCVGSSSGKMHLVNFEFSAHLLRNITCKKSQKDGDV